MPDFHFLRPEWFLAIIPVVVLFMIQRRQSALSGQWKNIVSPALQPYMLKKQDSTKQTSILKYAALLTAALTIKALAGPSWKKQPSQVFNSQSGLIIALDLSLSMTAQDISPSRLQRAKYKILDILDLKLGNNIALVAYAGDSHVASPLTRDIKTIQSMLPALDPYIMPKQGSDVRRLVDESIKLFEQGKSSPKTLLLVSDGIEENDIEYAASALKAAKIQLSILAVGTEQGAPMVQPDGRFFKDSNGQVIMPALEWDNLSALANQSNGRIRMLTSNDSDIKYLTNFEVLNEEFEETEESVVFDQWFDSGYWLIIPILFLSLLGFRKGIVLSICLIMLQPEATWANEQTNATTVSNLPDILLNSNQTAMKRFESDPESAAETFTDKKWKASSLYKANDHQAALEQWGEFSDTESLYNQANSLAYLNRLDEALATYEKVLESNPEHKDAKHNKAIIEKMMQQQDSQQSNDQKSDEKTEQDDSEKGDSDKQEPDQSKQGDGDPQDGEKSDQEPSKNGEKSEADQNQPSDNPANQEQQSEKDSEQQSADQNNPDDTDEKADQPTQAKQDGEESSDQEPLNAQQISKNAEQEQAMQQWMERIPDDPGGLLRNKFLYQYKNRNRNDQDGDRKPW